MTIQRHSSRRAPLRDMLGERLSRARRYLRVAGYFRSSLLELVGEEIGGVDEILVVCNAELDPNDVRVARAARAGSDAVSQTLVAKWMEDQSSLDALLERERYRTLHHLLRSGRMKVKVVPKADGNVFLHGKAGVVEFRAGGTTAFVGSMNESATGLKHSYEILWEDDDPAATEWVREEFQHFWSIGIDLPDAVVAQIGAMSHRREYASIDEARAADGLLQPGASLVDRPIYRTGRILRPWQKRFVQTCVDEWKIHGKARFLIADDVGLGKTLSMAAAALILAMLSDGAILILAPATLTRQWQTELQDLLGVPSAIWSATTKQWLDGKEFALSPRGDASAVARCPMRIGIVSTGLVVSGRDDAEAAHILKKRFAVVILDEAHKARADRSGHEGERRGAKRLLAFMETIAAQSDSVIIGSATPIQLRAVELHDLVAMLAKGAPHVLGREGSRSWASDTSMEYLTGDRDWPTDPTDQWNLLRNPLPSSAEHAIFRNVRVAEKLPDDRIDGPRYDALTRAVQGEVKTQFSQLALENNPIVRRVVRRSRQMLEDAGLLARIAVAIHPRADDHLPEGLFTRDGLEMGMTFRQAYDEAVAFCAAYATTRPAAGFMKTILLRRIGSSVAAGLNTTRTMLASAEPGSVIADENDELFVTRERNPLTAAEVQALRRIEAALAAIHAAERTDPKIKVLVHYLRDLGWLERHGMIAFSQFYDTADFAATALAEAFPREPIAIYAGGGRSYVIVGTERRRVEREEIKQKVAAGAIRLVAATDAACEGLNLQTLGSQANVDLPWNPSRLEQRKGRIQRIGQERPTIHVANLRYAGTYEDDVYQALSDRFADIFAVLGQLPDSFEDDWIKAAETDRDSVKNFPARVELAKPAMTRRYWRDVADANGLDWESTAKILSTRDIEEYMRAGWS